MSTSPFEIFRRNLKPMMVALVALSMFAFVVLPAVDSYMRRSGGAMGDPVVARFDGREITQSRVSLTTQTHTAVVRFLNDLAMVTINQKGGMPQVPGFQYDEQSKQVTSFGIDAQPDEQATIDTLRFYNEAKKAGFELDDTAVRNWLTQFTDGRLTDSEILSVLLQSTGNRLGEFHLYEQLRMLLLSNLYQRTAFVGLSSGQMPVVTPLGQWLNFLKLNQQATVDAYGVLVSEFIDETNADPGQSEIESVYEEGKDSLRFPNDQTPTPKFKRPDSADIEYLAADLNAFVEREKAKLTEEELRAEYERRLAGGDFQIPVDMPVEEEEPAQTGIQEKASEENNSTGEPSTDPPAEEAAAEMTNETGVPGSSDAPEAASEKTEPAATDEAKDDEAATSETAKEVDATEDSAAESVEDATSDAAPAEAAEAKAPREGDTSLKPSDRAVRLVMLQQEASAEDTDDESESAANEGNESETPESETPESETTEGEASQPEADSDADSTTEPDSADGSMGGLDLEDDNTETKAQPFEEVRDEIATDLASVPAREALDEAVTNVFNKMQRYFNLL
ncbi:MAG: hypothetical protein AAGD07_13615, partial [Planctomycetota bacterium]